MMEQELIAQQDFITRVKRYRTILHLLAVTERKKKKNRIQCSIVVDFCYDFKEYFTILQIFPCRQFQRQLLLNFW